MNETLRFALMRALGWEQSESVPVAMRLALMSSAIRDAIRLLDEYEALTGMTVEVTAVSDIKSPLADHIKAHEDGMQERRRLDRDWKTCCRNCGEYVCNCITGLPE